MDTSSGTSMQNFGYLFGRMINTGGVIRHQKNSQDKAQVARVNVDGPFN